MQETQARSLGWEDPLVKEMATHSILSWEIPWTSMGSLADSRVRRVAKRQTRLSDSTTTAIYNKDSESLIFGLA